MLSGTQRQSLGAPLSEGKAVFLWGKRVEATPHNSGAQIAQSEFSSDRPKTAGNTMVYYRGFLDDMTEYYASKMRAVNCAVLP